MKFYKILTFLFAVACLNACGKDPGPQIAKEQVWKYEKVVNLHGTVSNNSGQIKDGKVAARTLSGDLLAETTLGNTSHYTLIIPSGTVLPLILSFMPGEKSPETEKMISVVIHPALSQYDINPLTTAIAKQAKLLGGYTLRNMTLAAEERVHVPDANKTSTGFRGDPTTQYGGWH